MPHCRRVLTCLALAAWGIFAALLPLTLTLTDYARIERIADLPQRLTRGSAESTVPHR